MIEYLNSIDPGQQAGGPLPVSGVFREAFGEDGFFVVHARNDPEKQAGHAGHAYARDGQTVRFWCTSDGSIRLW